MVGRVAVDGPVVEEEAADSAALAGEDSEAAEQAEAGRFAHIKN